MDTNVNRLVRIVNDRGGDQVMVLPEGMAEKDAYAQLRLTCKACRSKNAAVVAGALVKLGWRHFPEENIPEYNMDEDIIT